MNVVIFSVKTAMSRLIKTGTVMTVKQLIAKLKQYPDDMPVATFDDIGYHSKDNPDGINVSIHTWIHGNYPYDLPDFEYVNLE